jgi:hypothetical protein
MKYTVDRSEELSLSNISHLVVEREMS